MLLLLYIFCFAQLEHRVMKTPEGHTHKQVYWIISLVTVNILIPSSKGMAASGERGGRTCVRTLRWVRENHRLYT